MIFIVWLLVLIFATFILYPKKTVRSKEYYLKYKNNGTLFLSAGLIFLVILVASFFIVDVLAKAQTNIYGGAAVFGLWLVFVGPLLFTLGFSLLLRGVKFLIEAKEIKKIE